MAQLIAHLFGDYIFQSHWMAGEKRRSTFPAILHAVLYGLAIAFVTQSVHALFVIVITHFVIDRWRLARYLIWVKNFMAPRAHWRPWKECEQTGYPDTEPVWLTTWLYIGADNAIHLLINYLSISHL